MDAEISKENTKERSCWKDLGLLEKMILKQALEKESESRLEEVVGFCENGDELADSTKSETVTM